MKVYSRWLIVWIANSVLFLLANKYFPANFVLGNAVSTPIAAAIFSGFLLTLSTRFAKQVLQRTKAGKMGRIKMFLVYSAVNAVGIWIIARFSVVSGFGIPAFYFAVYLGLAASLFQWLVRQLFKAVKLL